MEDGKYSHVFSSQKLLHLQNSVCQGTEMLNQPVLVPALFHSLQQTYSLRMPTSSNNGEQFGHTEQIPDK